MKLIDIMRAPDLERYTKTWLADDASEITADFDPDSAEGSAIFVIATGDTWMKNTKCQWQKVGSTEVAV